MRNRVSTVGLTLCLVAWPGFLYGQAPGPAASAARIAVINIQLAIANTAEGKKAFAEIERKYQPRQQELQRQQQEVAALQDQLQKQATTLSDEERLRLTRQADEKQKLFTRAREDAQADFQTESQDTFQRLLRKMAPLISDYAQQQGFLLVVDPSQIPVYYVAREIDITEEMAKRYDAANPVEGAGTPATTSPSVSAPAAPATRPASTAPRPSATSKPETKPNP